MKLVMEKKKSWSARTATKHIFPVFVTSITEPGCHIASSRVGVFLFDNFDADSFDDADWPGRAFS
jgi:hypothetical protein